MYLRMHFKLRLRDALIRDNWIDVHRIIYKQVRMLLKAQISMQSWLATTETGGRFSVSFAVHC